MAWDRVKKLFGGKATEPAPEADQAEMPPTVRTSQTVVLPYQGKSGTQEVVRDVHVTIISMCTKTALSRACDAPVGNMIRHQDPSDWERHLNDQREELERAISTRLGTGIQISGISVAYK